MRRSIPGFLALLALGACLADDGPSADTARVDPAMPVTTGVASAGATPYRALPGDGGAYDERADIGRGVLHLTVRADSVGRVREDTIVVRAAPGADADIIARWIHRYGVDWTWEYRLETSQQGLLRNDVEWSYEESGLPIDSVTADGAWVRVLHAVDAQGDQQRGWARTAQESRIEWWTDVLAEHTLFFRNQDSLAVHESPDGRRLWPDIAGANTGPDYALTPLQRSNQWMRVILTTPSDFCVDPPVVRKDTVWIRYLDERGRPRVWYYPRGC